MIDPQKTGEKGQLSPGTWRERKSQIKHKWVKPFAWLEWLLFSKPVFKFFQLIAYLWIMYGILIYYQGKDDRIKQKQYQAWQIINLAQGKTGSGGRIQALEELNKDGVSLAGIDVATAYLAHINLSGAKLQKANLWRTDLQEANLRGAYLLRADLREAYLMVTNLQEATLWGADLRGATFLMSDLQRACLIGADLREAKLLSADLREVNFQEANLQGAYLFNVELQKAKNLTIKQLSKVKTLYESRFDTKIEEQIRKNYPHLLEKPKDSK